ncbi:MAG TPA: hypothetical protein VKM54_10445 [Myxococcota bacterium]|nr:hypothetical protein [Myxococcota bacterium]
MKLFLIVYDRKTGTLRELVTYRAEQREVALRERFAREEAERGHEEIEVVLLGADSLDALKKTHSRYFKTLEEFSRPSAG